MTSPRKDYALLLEAAGPVDTELAKQLLDERGIPCLVHGPDFDVAELGVVAHQSIRGANLYVPHSALEEALRAIEEAWGPGAGSRE